MATQFFGNVLCALVINIRAMFLLCSSANGPKKHQQFIYSSWDKKAWQTAVLHWKATKNGIIGHVYCIFMTAAVRDWFSSILQHLGLPLWAVLLHPTGWLSWKSLQPVWRVGLWLVLRGGESYIWVQLPGMVLLLLWEPGARMAIPHEVEELGCVELTLAGSD